MIKYESLRLNNVEKIQRNIDAVERAINNKPLGGDDMLLIDVKYILIAIAKMYGVKIND